MLQAEGREREEEEEVFSFLRVSFRFFFVRSRTPRIHPPPQFSEMASPAPSPRGTPPTLKDRLREPLDDHCSLPQVQTTTSNAGDVANHRASPLLLSFAPGAVAAMVSPLPPRVASRWAGSSGSSPASGSNATTATRDSIDAKLLAAEGKRQASRERKRREREKGMRDAKPFWFFVASHAG